MSDDFLDDVLDGVDLQNTDTSQRGAFTPIPAGEYLIQAIEGSVVRKDSGDAMIKLTFEVMEGEFAERKLFVNLNIRHSNPTAQRIATEELTEIWRDAMGGTGNPPSTEALLWKPIRAKVAVEKRKDTGEMQNRVKRYFSASGEAPGIRTSQPAQPQRQAAASQPAQGRRPDWLKKPAA